MTAMSYRMTLTFESDREHPPILIQIAVPEELALKIMAQRLVRIDARIEQAPLFLSDIPILGAKEGGKTIL